MHLKRVGNIMKIKFKDNITIESKLVGPIPEDKTPFAIGAKQPRYDIHNKFTIIITQNNTSASFAFYDSTHNHKLSINDLSPYDTLMAFRCILEDALSGNMDIDEFMNEFGYEDLEDARRIHYLCIKTKDKIDTFNFDIYDLINEIIDYENANTIDEHIITIT